jgi:hypothetical protein
MDVRRALSLQGALRAAAGAIGEQSAAEGSEAMLHSYRHLRQEVPSIIPEEDVSEFDRLFPQNISGRGRTRDELQVGRYYSARSALHQMAGWLEGFSQVIQLEANAQAYSTARLKETPR